MDHGRVVLGRGESKKSKKSPEKDREVKEKVSKRTGR